MTQPPIPGAAASKIACPHGTIGYCPDCWKEMACGHGFLSPGCPICDGEIIDNVRDAIEKAEGKPAGTVGYDRIARAAIAAMPAAAAEEASRYEFAPGSHDGGAPWTGQPTSVAAERTKPAASDHEVATKLVNSYLVDIGVCNDGHTNYEEALVEEIAAALAERGRAERERAAKIAEGEPGSMIEPSRKRIAAAIRNAGESNG